MSKAREWGLINKTRKGGNLSASQIQHILMNPFYYGEMRIKGELHPHNYRATDHQRTVRPVRGRPARKLAPDRYAIFGEALRLSRAVQMRGFRSDVTSDLKKKRHVYLDLSRPGRPCKKLFVPEGDPGPSRGGPALDPGA